jgi:hypothetical protein
MKNLPQLVAACGLAGPENLAALGEMWLAEACLAPHSSKEMIRPHVSGGRVALERCTHNVVVGLEWSPHELGVGLVRCSHGWGVGVALEGCSHDWRGGVALERCPIDLGVGLERCPHDLQNTFIQDFLVNYGPLKGLVHGAVMASKATMVARIFLVFAYAANISHPIQLSWKVDNKRETG